MQRNTPEWSLFVKKQKEEILKRHDKKYNNIDVIKEQLRETGNISIYQSYKIDVVSKFQRRALEKIQAGTYGICDVCKNEIPIERLNLVPAALTCTGCDNEKGLIN